MFLFIGQREINNLQVRCANTERGCQWTGTVGTLDSHIASCQFSLVPCPNRCEEDKGAGKLLLIRKHLDQHLNTKCLKRAYECPHCGEKGTFASIKEYHDQVCAKKIIACPNKGSGCSLCIERGRSKEHVSSDCEYTEVACVYESLGCGVTMLRKDKATHEIEAREKHMDLSLVNVKLLSGELKSLTLTVNLYEEKCKGIKESIALKDKQHKSLTEEHNKLLKKNETLTTILMTVSDNHETLSKKNLTLERQLMKLSEKHETLSKKHETLLDRYEILSDTVSLQTRKEKFIFKLPHYASKKEKNLEFFSTPFYSDPCGYKMCIIIYPNGCGIGKGTHVSVFTKLLAGRYDNQLHWPFLGTVTCELLNQLEDINHHSKVTTFTPIVNMRVDSSRGNQKFLRHSSLGHNPAINTQYLQDDTLYFGVSVKVDSRKPWLVCTDPKSNRTIDSSTVVIFRITDYNKLKTRNMETRSDSFYTSSGGYQMCIKIDANGVGDGKGTHVSVFTQVLKGRYDNQLHWPFRGTVTLELLNQLGDNNHHSREATHGTREDMRANSTGYGYSKFIPHSSLGHNPVTNTQYLLNDTLYFKVSVKVDNHKPWLVCMQPISIDP